MSTIVDPTNENVAIVNGRIAMAVRIGPVNEAAPTAAEVNSWPIIGYGNFPITPEGEV